MVSPGAREPQKPESYGWWIRRGPWVILLAPIVPQIIGSIYNIWYNVLHIQPLLGERSNLHEAFVRTTVVFNAIVYPVITGFWAWIVLPLGRPFRRLLRGAPVAPGALARARRRSINLPWWGLIFACSGWLLCIPVFLLSLRAASDASNRFPQALYWHLPVSFVISALIATTLAIFLIELLSHRLLFPVLFRDARPADTPGALALGLRGRMLLWALAGGVSPLISIVLLILPPHQVLDQVRGFALSVAGLGIVVALTVFLVGGALIAEPVEALRRASKQVAEGDLTVRVPLKRGDEFGLLIDQFNDTTAGLEEKERLAETFGRHVGREAARQILALNTPLGGVEAEVTVIFVDIRGFTQRVSGWPPERVVTLVNQFLTEMVEAVDNHGGLINKFMGDGFMAVFGASGQAGHADAALAAGREMLARVGGLNARLQEQGYAPLQIGIGINTGRTVVGCIGSPGRAEWTAIGATVNLASRVEALTKVVGSSLLLTAATRAALTDGAGIRAFPPQPVRGEPEPVTVFGLGGEESVRQADGPMV